MYYFSYEIVGSFAMTIMYNIYKENKRDRSPKQRKIVCQQADSCARATPSLVSVSCSPMASYSL